jgi:hypothetical protein
VRRRTALLAHPAHRGQVAQACLQDTTPDETQRIVGLHLLHFTIAQIAATALPPSIARTNVTLYEQIQTQQPHTSHQ